MTRQLGYVIHRVKWNGEQESTNEECPCLWFLYRKNVFYSWWDQKAHYIILSPYENR